MKNLSNVELLRKHSKILDELKRRNVIRTRNNPVSDYAEWLVCEKMHFTIMGNSTRGVDAIDKRRRRYQIKARHLDSLSSSRQLGVIRDLKKRLFDYLIVVLFDKNFGIESAYCMPRRLIRFYARYSKHQNGHILVMKGDVLNSKSVKDIKRLLN